MARIPQKFAGLLGKFAESLNYDDLPKRWADNPEIVSAAEELYRDMGTESPFFKAWAKNGDPYSVEKTDGFFLKTKEPIRNFSDSFYNKWFGSGEQLKKDFPEKDLSEIFNDPEFVYNSQLPEELFYMSPAGRVNAQSLLSSGFNGSIPEYHISVRHGFIPEGGLSKNHAENFPEKGLSVVDFLTELIDKKGQIKKTYYDLSFGKRVPKNIVGGWHTGNYGSDGEPLVLLPQIIGETKNIGNIAKSESNKGTFNPRSKNVYKAVPLAVGGAGAAALGMSPDEAEAAAYGKARRPPIAGAATGTALGSMPVEAPLEEPMWSPVDMLVAPVGVAGAGAKAAAMAADPLIAYGMDKAAQGAAWLWDKGKGTTGYRPGFGGVMGLPYGGMLGMLGGQ